MLRTLFVRPLLGLFVVATLGGVAATPALAYGASNWQIGFAGTATVPGTGFGFGFWGWCAFGGGVTSGNSGDCQVSQYIHSPSGRVTCEQDINVTSWTTIPTGTFVVTGTATTHPAGALPLCFAAMAITPTFTDANTGIPAAAGHYNLGAFFGTRGEFQAQVTLLP